MTLDDAKQWVAHVASLSHDDENAHHTEDDVMRLFIADIANGQTEDIRDVAAELLKMYELDFHRWCA